ncbi:hypothetical protein BBP40_007281 [Aspergillus hancockii]|nr:hypothetical protein BBP40_007281 [Aspergillus hancockii]
MRVTLRALVPLISALCLIGWVVANPQSKSEFVPLEFDRLEILERDVAIIGGGLAGIYAAIRLRQLAKGVVIIEKETRLGGHSNTYIDPATGIPVGYGLKTFLNMTVTRNYLAHFNIPLVPENFGGNRSESVDFTTGKPITVVPINIPPEDAEASAALERYMGLLAQYPFLADEYYHLPNPVPKDLLLSFGDFVIKYNLGAIVPLVATYVWGFGDPLLKTTLYILKTFSLKVIRGLQDGQLTYVLAHTPSGQKLIHAKKILVAIPQTIENLAPFNLDKTEEAIFAQFTYTFYYTTVTKNIDQSVPVVINCAHNTSYNLPKLPGIYGIFKTPVPDLKWVVYGSSTFMTNEDAKLDMVDSLLRIRHPNITVTKPEIVAFRSYVPYELTVPVDAIKNGFYRQLEVLQGHR